MHQLEHARALVVAGLLALPYAGTALAADHALTAISAGGITEDSQPFRNGINNPGRNSEDVVGQGSPLSGEDSTTPATDQANSGQVSQGNTAPSQHSAHVK